MNKGKNCFFAILVFGLTMAVFNGSRSYWLYLRPSVEESFREQME